MSEKAKNLNKKKTELEREKIKDILKQNSWLSVYEISKKLGFKVDWREDYLKYSKTTKRIRHYLTILYTLEFIETKKQGNTYLFRWKGGGVKR